MKFTLELTETQEKRLTELAERLNVPLEKLVAAVLRDLASQPEPDFDAAALRVLRKNEDLYRRLG